MNKVILLGRLTKDCNTKYTQTGKCVTTFTLAVNRPTTKDGEQQADFVPVVLWGKVAETVGNYVHKGQRLLVEGRLHREKLKRYLLPNMIENLQKCGFIVFRGLINMEPAK